MLSNREKRDRLLSLSNELFIIKKWDYSVLNGINLIEHFIFTNILKYAQGEEIPPLKLLYYEIKSAIFSLIVFKTNMEKTKIEKLDSIIKKYLLKEEKDD